MPSNVSIIRTASCTVSYRIGDVLLLSIQLECDNYRIGIGTLRISKTFNSHVQTLVGRGRHQTSGYKEKAKIRGGGAGWGKVEFGIPDSLAVTYGIHEICASPVSLIREEGVAAQGSSWKVM